MRTCYYVYSATKTVFYLSKETFKYLILNYFVIFSLAYLDLTTS